MEMLENRPVQTPGASVVVIPIGETVPEVLNTAEMLRASGIRTSIDTSKRKLKKSLATASSKGIRHVILIGENEENLRKARILNYKIVILRKISFRLTPKKKSAAYWDAKIKS